MKVAALFVFLLCLSCHAQDFHVSLTSTNPLILDRVISTNGSVLMTNAEFRTSMGTNLIFKSGFALERFSVSQVHSNVLVALNLDLDGLDAAQKKLADANAAYAAARAQQLTNAQQSAAVNAALYQQAQSAAAAAASNAANASPANPPAGRPHHRRL